MDAGTSPVRQPRVKHRQELRTLTYVTLDQGNGGIVRNLSQEGVGVQVVAAVRARQQLRVRFELREPRLRESGLGEPGLRVDSRGEVMWATRSGQCGIRFLELSPQVAHQINEWIFGSLLEEAAHSDRTGSMFSGTPFGDAVLAESLELPACEEAAREQDDGLMVSATPLKVIELTARRDSPPQAPMFDEAAETAACDLPQDWSPEDWSQEDLPKEDHSQEKRLWENLPFEIRSPELDWLSRPLSGRGLVWTINILVALAALLLVVLVFLSVTGEPPRWPLAMMSGAAVCVGGLYWGFFHWFAGASPGARLARMVASDYEEDEELRGARFR